MNRTNSISAPKTGTLWIGQLVKESVGQCSAKRLRHHKKFRSVGRTPFRDPACRLSQTLFHFVQPIGTLEYLARLRTVGGAHDAVLLHQVDQVRGPPIADA